MPTPVFSPATQADYDDLLIAYFFALTFAPDISGDGWADFLDNPFIVEVVSRGLVERGADGSWTRTAVE